jgi:ribosome biogenesis GTPase
VREIHSIVPGVTVHVTSALTGMGLENLTPYLQEGRTAVFLGSSGVGKSTIINSLYGNNILRTSEIRDSDETGKHITTSRQMIIMPGGGIVIDTPGLREIEPWTSTGKQSQSFTDIEEIARACRFNNCRHDQEPDCAVKQAVEGGRLDPDRYRNYLKMLRESEHLAAKQSRRVKIEESRWVKHMPRKFIRSLKDSRQ